MHYNPSLLVSGRGTLVGESRGELLDRGTWEGDMEPDDRGE